MARGHDRHREHQQALAALGRGLARRCGSACELCAEKGSLKVIEVEGGPEEPEEDWAVMLCERCQEVVTGARRHDAGSLRFLETAVWSEVRPVQIAAVRVTRGLAAAGVEWATDCLDGLYLDPEVEEIIG
jgi:hypothetical protein